MSDLLNLKLWGKVQAPKVILIHTSLRTTAINPALALLILMSMQSKKWGNE